MTFDPHKKEVIFLSEESKNENKELMVISDSVLLTGLTPKECVTVYEKVNPFIEIYKKSEIIIHQGYESSNIGIVVSGRAFSEKYHINGARQIMRKYKPENLMCMEGAFSRNATSPVTIITKTKCEILWLSHLKLIRSQLLSSEIKNKIYENIMYEMTDENIRLMYKTDVLAQRTVRERVLTYLSIITEKRKSNSVRIHMSQVEFADYLCVDRSALSAELNSMRREKIISYDKDCYIVNVRPKEY